eukprot:CAMPEP_0194195382 /NCGR_PEP_ID=MMETSP0154-20130528/76103_1 /TAXON_ID=1049557 /ORGANISM="Thalassiothrix antarctica, Strain L6-D1" /LENGTH=319 /DNA_ID=CAMNT_0038919909 /DNA_START=654 /DNA_END=1614 /DNA_ORIENTATION=-
MGIDTNNRIILSQMKDESSVSVLESTEGTLKIGVLDSGEIDELYEMLTSLQSHNNSDILDDAWSGRSILRNIIVPKEDSNRDIFMENVIAIGNGWVVFIDTSIFIYRYSNSINNSMGIDTNNRIILSQMKDESDESVLEAIEGTLKIKALNSGGIDELYEMSTALQNNNNNSEILDDVWRKKSRLRDIIVPKEESNRDIFMENVIAIGQEKIEFGMAMEEVTVEVSQECNVSIENEWDLSGSEEILSEWKGALMKEETYLFSNDNENKMYHLMVSSDLGGEHSGEYDESQDHSEIVKVFAEQFRMEHAFSVQNFGSEYI